MNGDLVFERRFYIERVKRGRRLMQPGEAPSPLGPVPRITRLMALAIEFDRLLRAGQVASQAELARLGHVSRTRLTQIMNLTLLAPDIQERCCSIPVRMRGPSGWPTCSRSPRSAIGNCNDRCGSNCSPATTSNWPLMRAI